MFQEIQIYLNGNRDLYLENFKGIICYDETGIRIKTKNGALAVTGHCLQILYYSCDEMKISGDIQGIEFLA